MFPTITTSNSTPIKKISQISHLIAHRNLINKKIKNLLNWIDVLRLQDFSTIKQINRRGERERERESTKNAAMLRRGHESSVKGEEGEALLHLLLP